MKWVSKSSVGLPLVKVFPSNKTSLTLGDRMPPPSVNADMLREVTLLRGKLVTWWLSPFHFSLWDQGPSACSAEPSLGDTRCLPHWLMPQVPSPSDVPWQCHFFKHLSIIHQIFFFRGKKKGQLSGFLNFSTSWSWLGQTLENYVKRLRSKWVEFS